MNARIGFSIFLIIGCGNFQEHPERFTLSMVAPEQFGPVDIHSGSPAQVASLSGPRLVCSASDPFAVITVESHGCDRWTPSLLDEFGRDAYAEITTLDPHRKMLKTPLFQGSSHDMKARARCDSDSPIEIRFPFRTETGQIDQLDFGIPEPIRDLLPLPGDRFLLVTDKRIVPIGRNASESWVPGTPTVEVDRRARVYLSGDRVVLKDACDAFACDDERANVYTFVFGQSPLNVAINALPASMQYLGSLDDSRLVFYQPVLGDPMLPANGHIVVLSADSLQPMVDLPLPSPAFPADVRVLPGIVGPTGLQYIGAFNGQLRRVRIDRMGGSVGELDLGKLDDTLDGVRQQPDANAFLYWGHDPFDKTKCTLGLRDAESGADLWTQPRCVLDGVATQFQPDYAPQFIWDGERWLVVTVSGKQLLALDAQSGATRWSWDRVFPIKGLRVHGDALIVSTFYDLHVIGADGQPRFHTQVESEVTGDGFIATSDGQLLGADGSQLMHLDIGDPQLHAPPHTCTRIDCGRGEVDLAADVANCGQCGHACDAGEQCYEGVCATTPSL
jgi:hypothetical protein